jgi:hypothetical protein
MGSYFSKGVRSGMMNNLLAAGREHGSESYVVCTGVLGGKSLVQRMGRNAENAVWPQGLAQLYRIAVFLPDVQAVGFKFQRNGYVVVHYERDVCLQAQFAQLSPEPDLFLPVLTLVTELEQRGSAHDCPPYPVNQVFAMVGQQVEAGNFYRRIVPVYDQAEMIGLFAFHVFISGCYGLTGTVLGEWWLTGGGVESWLPLPYAGIIRIRYSGFEAEPHLSSRKLPQLAKAVQG